MPRIRRLTRDAGPIVIEASTSTKRLSAIPPKLEIHAAGPLDISYCSNDPYLDCTIDSYVSQDSDNETLQTNSAKARNDELAASYFLGIDSTTNRLYITREKKHSLRLLMPHVLKTGDSLVQTDEIIKYLLGFYSVADFEYQFKNAPPTSPDQLKQSLRAIFQSLPLTGKLCEIKFYSDLLENRPPGSVSSISAKVLELCQIQAWLYCAISYLNLSLDGSAVTYKRCRRIPRFEEFSVAYLTTALRALFDSQRTWNDMLRTCDSQFLSRLNNNHDEQFRMFILSKISMFLLRVLDLLPYVVMDGAEPDTARLILTDTHTTANGQVWELHKFVMKFSHKIQSQLNNCSPVHTIRKPVKTKFVELSLRMDAIKANLQQILPAVADLNFAGDSD